MKLLFHNRRLPARKCGVGAGSGLRGIHLTTCRFHVGGTSSLGDRFSLRLLLDGRTFHELSVQTQADSSLSIVANRERLRL